MRWLTGIAAGICAGIVIFTAGYGVNAADDWHSHRAVSLAQLAVMEGDPGYPNRAASIRSEREQVEILDREARKAGIISVLALAISLGAFVPLWRRAVKSFGVPRLSALVAVTAVLFLGSLGLALLMLSAGVIRG